MEDNKNKNERASLKEYFDFGPLVGYFFRKKDKNRPTSFNLRAMHGINKLSIIMFLIAVVVIVFRFLTR